MTSPVDEHKTLHDQDGKNRNVDTSPSDDTYVTEPNHKDYLKVDTSYGNTPHGIEEDDEDASMRTPSARREQATRLEDDLMLLQAERVASRSTQGEVGGSEHQSLGRVRSRREPIDEFDEATNPLHEKAAIYKPPEDPNTKLSAFVKKVHQSSFIVRYITYIVPVVLILLIPLLIGALKYRDADVGGVQLVWFSIWLEIVWLTLWAGRVSSQRDLRLAHAGTNIARLRSSASVYHLLSVSWLVFSPIMQRNGATWPCNWSCTQRYSSGGSEWKFHSCPP